MPSRILVKCYEICEKCGTRVRDGWTDFRHGLEFFDAVLLALRDQLWRLRQSRWQSTFYYMDQCGSGAMPIISLLGFLIGVILSLQAFSQLYRYGVDSYVVNLVGPVIVTELAPLMTAVVLAGRSGSAFAAEISTMKAGEEIDALSTMGLDPYRFLIVPKVMALMLVMPGLTMLADACGVLGGGAIICNTLGFSLDEYMLKTVAVIQPLDLVQGLCKSAIFGLIIAGVGCHKGISASRDAEGVGKAATSATVTSIFFIIITDALLTAGFN